MGIIRIIKRAFDSGYDKFVINHRRKGEIKKFTDKRRVAITNSVTLTKDQQLKIDKLYKSNYGQKIPYTWHKNFMAHSGKFDEKYFPEMLYIPEFEYFMNFSRDYVTVFADKNVTPFVADKVGVKTPKVFISITNGLIRDDKFQSLTILEAEQKLQNAGKVFAKPTVESSSGRGCCIAEFIGGVDLLSKKSVKDFILSLGQNAVIQERVQCHKSLRDIYPDSVNTFRIITYRWKDEILHMPIIMRIGQGGNFVDNAHAGGMFIAVDDDGALHEKAITEFNLQYDKHPNTGIVYKNVKLELVPKLIESAKKLHVAICQVGVVNWDFTIDESGEPMLIEANIKNGSVWLSQMAHGVGAFGDKTEEVLRWLKFMKKLKPSSRKKYAFGKME